MTIEIHSLQRIRAFVEGTFGANSIASLASFVDIPVIEGSAQLAVNTAEIDSGELKQHIDDGRKRVLGKKSWSLTFAMNLAPSGTPSVAGTPPPQTSLGYLLKSVMGGESLVEGQVADSGSTASVIVVDGTPNCEAGDLMGWRPGTPGAPVQWREVEGVSGANVTLKHGFSSAPAAEDVLYGAATYYMTANPSDSLAFFVEGLEQADRWLLAGGQATGGIAITVVKSTEDQLPRITFTMTGVTYFKGVGTVGSPLEAAEYEDYEPIVAFAGEYRITPIGEATPAAEHLVDVTAETWEPHIAFVPYSSPSGVQGVKRFVKQRNSDCPVQGSFTTAFDGSADVWWTRRDARTDVDVMRTLGTEPGECIVLSAPCIQILNPQRGADGDGIAAQVVMWKGRRDIDVGAVVTDKAKSPFRLHVA